MTNNSTKKTQTKNNSKEKETIIQEVEMTEPVQDSGSKNNKPIVPKEIDSNQYVAVINGFQGRLVYISKHTGERFIWDEFGAEQDMELSELKRAKSSNKKFFVNNWFMFNEQWIIDYLGLNQYYKYAVKIEDFDKLFEMSVSELEDTLSKMSDGQKKSVAYRARQLIAEGKIDSNKVITTLEKCLNTELIDRL